MKDIKRYKRIALKILDFLPLYWLALWIPLSYCFPQNPHFPFALLAPVMGFVSIFMGGWSGHAFTEVTLPWLVFWGGLIVSVIIAYLCEQKLDP